MTINTAIEQLLEAEATHGQNILTHRTLAIGVARVGTDSQQVVWCVLVSWKEFLISLSFCSGTLTQLQAYDFGGPLHSLVIVGKTHIVEDECLEMFKIKE